MKPRKPDPWLLLTGGLVLLLTMPLIVVISGLFGPPEDAWHHAAEHLLPRYLSQTTWLLLATLPLALLLGLPQAWLVTAHDFPGRRLFGVLLVLPLTLPGYIAAYAWSGFMDWSGPLQTWLRAEGIEIPPGSLDIRTLPGLALVLSSVLFPYVYLTCRVSFARQSRTAIEAARTLGLSPAGAFLRVALPLAWPAAAAGCFLVAMETLNDYGAVHYFGVDTLTVGIFRTWFALGAEDTALRIASLLLIGAFTLAIAERWLRRRRRFDEVKTTSHPLERTRLKGWSAGMAIAACGIPLLLGLVVPMGTLFYWAGLNREDFLDPRFLELTGNSVLLAAVTAVVVTLASLLILAVHRVVRPAGRASVVGAALPRIGQMGYAIPAAVLGVGALVVASEADGALHALTGWLSGEASTGLILRGSLTILLFAYLARFLAVGLQPVDGAYARFGPRVDEAARSLGAGPTALVGRVHLPLLRRGLLASMIFVFIDVMKELPLTLILRPFDFETLATRTFVLAGDEMIPESAVPSLVLVLISVPTVLLLDRLTRERS